MREAKASLSLECPETKEGEVRANVLNQNRVAETTLHSQFLLALEGSGVCNGCLRMNWPFYMSWQIFESTLGATRLSKHQRAENKLLATYDLNSNTRFTGKCGWWGWADSKHVRPPDFLRRQW